MQKIRTPGPQCFSYWLLHNKLGGLKYFTIWAGQFSVLCGVYLGWIRQEGFFTPMSGIRAGMLETTVGWRVSCSVMSDSLWTRGLYPPGASVHGDSPGKNTGVGYHALLQGIFPTQGSNSNLFCLLNWQAGPLPALPGKPHSSVSWYKNPPSDECSSLSCSKFHRMHSRFYFQ